jgi:pyruvate dehydrogenase E2 component (dihydrolipoamide acetyltransferase)
MRDAIAAAMTRSKGEIPHYLSRHTISMKRALTWLGDANARLIGVNERVITSIPEDAEPATAPFNRSAA